MEEACNVLKEVCLTEKATNLSSNLNQYVFEVYRSANKTEIASAIERTFKVKVLRVNTINQKGKRKRSRTQRGKFHKRPDVKKAIVSLEVGNTIDLL